MNTNVALILLMLIFGLGGALFGIVYFVAWLIGLVGEGIGSLFRQGPTMTMHEQRNDGLLQCTNDDCRHVERRAAVYCCRCGSHLSRCT